MKFWRFSFQLQQFDSFWRRESTLCMSDTMTKGLWIGVKTSIESCLTKWNTFPYVFPQSKTILPSKTTTCEITCFQPAKTRQQKSNTEAGCRLPACRYKIQVSGHGGLSTGGATSNANDKGLHMVLFTFTFPQHRASGFGHDR